MGKVEHLLVTSMLHVAVVDPRHTDARHRSQEYFVELAHRFDGVTLTQPTTSREGGSCNDSVVTTSRRSRTVVDLTLQHTNHTVLVVRP
jgi:hypothetical protein